MKAYVISASPVEARILVNVLQKQGVAASAAQAPADVADRLGEEGMVFFDWDHSTLSVSQKTALLNQLRRNAEGRVFAVGARTLESEILAALDGNATQAVFKPIESEDIKRKVSRVRKAAFAKVKLDARVINVFIQAVVSTFETMIRMSPAREKVYMLDPDNQAGVTDALCDISGVMGLSGDYTGSVVISMPSRLALKATADMLGEDQRPTLDTHVRDCLGEIVNIIAGQAKAGLANTPYRFELALPTVVVGKGHKVHIQEDTPTLVIVFKVEGESFAIQVNIRPSGA